MLTNQDYLIVVDAVASGMGGVILCQGTKNLWKKLFPSHIQVHMVSLHKLEGV